MQSIMNDSYEWVRERNFDEEILTNFLIDAISSPLECLPVQHEILKGFAPNCFIQISGRVNCCKTCRIGKFDDDHWLKESRTCRQQLGFVFRIDLDHMQVVKKLERFVAGELVVIANEKVQQYVWEPGADRKLYRQRLAILDAEFKCQLSN